MACRIIDDEKSGTKVPRKGRKNALTERRKDSERMPGAGNDENQHLMLEQTTKNGRQSRVQIKFGRNGRSSRIVSRTMNDAKKKTRHFRSAKLGGYEGKGRVSERTKGRKEREGKRMRSQI